MKFLCSLAVPEKNFFADLRLQCSFLLALYLTICNVCILIIVTSVLYLILISSSLPSITYTHSHTQTPGRLILEHFNGHDATEAFYSLHSKKAIKMLKARRPMESKEAALDAHPMDKGERDTFFSSSPPSTLPLLAS